MGGAALATGERARADGRSRIGSVTRTFVATVTLQPAAGGRIRLDGPVEEYLPGAVRNGRNITVRQLLNHTSGLHDRRPAPEFALGHEASARRYPREGRWKAYGPRELLDVAARRDPHFAPGRGRKDSNTNHVLVGMVIEEVSGRSWQREVERRILRPLRLGGTVVPTTSPRVPGPHAEGYLPLPEGPADVSLLNPSVAGAAGGAVSTTADPNRFPAALLGRRLLPEARLAEMPQAVPAASYGPGVIR